MRPYLYLSMGLLSLAMLSGCGNSVDIPAASSAAAPSQTTATTTNVPAASNSSATSQPATAAPAGEIVFSRMTIAMMNTELFTMNADGMNQQQITHSPDMEFFPRWSPDGSQIAFNYVGVRDESTSWPVVQVYTMHPDGSERLQRTGTISSTMNDMYPEWSADGTRIAYSTIAYTGIWAIDLHGSAPQRLEPYDSMSGYNGLLDWSPDGNSFLIEAQGIKQIKTDGKLIKRLTDHELDHDAAWSPDGTQIAFVRHHRDSVSSPADIFVMNADGSNLRQLTRTPAIDRTPRWSPDGKRIVFSSPGVQLTPPTPTVQPTLTPALPTTTGYPMPSNEIEYAPLQNAPEDIFVINVDGSGLTNLTNSPEHEMTPDWKP